MTTTIRLGISSCLLGHEVRFDGGHKRDRFLTDTFGRYVEWVAVCPEVEAGFGTPREAIRLTTADGAVRLVTVKTGVDVTDAMERFARRRLNELVQDDLSGYVLKKDSPSCGMARVKIYDAGGVATRTGEGLFAAALRQQFPCLPVEEEGRLSDPRLRENFVERVFAYRRLSDFFGSRWSIGGLVRFHAAQKLALMAHSIQAYQQLGRLVADAKVRPRGELHAQYRETFMAALERLATPARHANVLQHMAGYVARHLDAAGRAELAETIDDYRHGRVPLIVPITLLRHHVRQHDVSYLAGQIYLEPHPKELGLRNHV